ncbi:MAG: xanthine dehydrogenase accessory protein XdhC [Oceanisphaera sp.]|nr:xanthine dehydrogenase accessory protein XdhC [Oceanisphaera sp.]
MRHHHRWYDALHQGQHNRESLVLVTVLSTAGSTPRDAAAKMVVTAAEHFDTIGGGHLEFKAIERARELLKAGTNATEVESISLGASLGQCCGGATQLLYEVLVPAGQPLLVFGAGHVAQHLMPILAPLDLTLHWVDPRPDWLAQNTDARIRREVLEHPTDAMADAPQNAWVLIFTHNHQLDFELVQTALKRPDIDYIGLIGSDTKARRFQQRLAHRGWSDRDIKRVICPVGLSAVPGKQPAEVAVSIAAQLLNRLYADRPADPGKKATGLNWKAGRALGSRGQVANTNPDTETAKKEQDA